MGKGVGKGERRRRRPVPGGVIWWDKNGVQNHTPYPPASPITPAVLMFVFGFSFGLPSLSVLLLGASMGGLVPLVSVGVVLLLLSILLCVGGYKCYQKRKNDTITIVYPGTGGVAVNGLNLLPSVQYMVGGRLRDQPPPGYVPPPGFQMPQVTVYQPPAGVPPGGQQGYYPTAPHQGGFVNYPAGTAPPQGGFANYPAGTAPPQGGFGNYPAGSAPPGGYPAQYPGYPPASSSPQPSGQATGANSTQAPTSTQDAPPPSYNEVVNKM